MISNEHIDRLLEGRGSVIGTNGEKIGSVGQVYTDDDTGRPNWVTVRTGLFGTRESFVPIQEARVEGEDLVIPYTKDQVKDAPGVDPDGHLDPAEEDRLYQHYRIAGGRSYTDTDATGTGTRSGTARDYDDTTARGTVGHDTSGATTDDAMTRSEEQLHVGKEREATGRARLRKYVTTENVTKTIPVEREEVRIRARAHH